MDFGGPGYYHPGRGGTAQEVTDGANRPFNVATVGADILSSDIGAEFLVAMWRSVEDEAEFSPLLGHSIFLRPEEHTQLQRHVEPRQLCLRIQLRPRDIVDADLALGDNSKDFCNSYLTGIGQLQSASSDVATIVNRENDRVKKPSIGTIERAVDENAQLVFAAHLWGRLPSGGCPAFRCRFRGRTVSLAEAAALGRTSFNNANCVFDLRAGKGARVF